MTTVAEPLIRIPRGPRGAILTFFEGDSVRLEDVLDELYMRTGFGDTRDLIREIRSKFGDAAAEGLKERAQEEMELAVSDQLGSAMVTLSGRTTASAADAVRQEAEPRALLLHVPDAMFATAIEGACACQAAAWGEYDKSRPTTETEIFVNERLAKVGAPYRLDDDKVQWVGDEDHDELANQPALRALADPRLEVVRVDFENAMGDLREGTRESLKEAVNKGAKALEGALGALLDANAVARPQKNQVWALYEAARDADLLPKEQDMMKELIVAGSRVSNVKGRHANPEDVTLIEAEVSVTAVANAVHYIATLLPVE